MLDSVFFFKQKTAYEMRISDWSSDVCSSDLIARCPPCAGLNDPPSKPVRIIQTSAWVDQGNRANRGELIRCHLPHSCGAHPLRGPGFYPLRTILYTVHDRDVGVAYITINPSPFHTARVKMTCGLAQPRTHDSQDNHTQSSANEHKTPHQHT